MASYPEIMALDFTVCLVDGKPVQNPVYVPDYAFQYTANYDHYQLQPHDLLPIKVAGADLVVLRGDVAVCYWESVKMKIRHILAAAQVLDGDFTIGPLPTDLPKSKCNEIGMIPPPFPDPLHLVSNFLLKPEKPEVVKEWVQDWQRTSLMLSAWICEAKLQCNLVPDCSWYWPQSLLDIYQSNHTNKPNFGNQGFVLTQAEGKTPTVMAHTNHTTSEPQPHKRARTITPEPVSQDNPDDWHMVLWQPTPIQRWERERDLKRGFVGSDSNRPITPPTPATSPIPVITTHPINSPIPAITPHSTNTALSHTNRPILPLPLRLSQVINQGPFLFEYESGSKWSRGRFEF